MKKSAFLIPAIATLALAGAALAQESTPTPSPTPETAAEKPPEQKQAAPDASPSATPVPEESEKPAGQDAPPPDATSDADLLPQPAPSDEPPPPPDAALPTDEVLPGDIPNPDNLVPPDVSTNEAEPPPAPNIAENKYQSERKLKVRYQEVKLQALKSADVRSLNEQAGKATTDEAKRQALREYYRLLFARMVAIDASLKDKCDLMEKAYLRRLGQYQVEPTIPLNPPPTPEPLDVVAASPTPKPSN